MPSITINFTTFQGQRVSDALGLDGTPPEQLAAFKAHIIQHYKRIVRRHDAGNAAATFDDNHLELEVT